MALGANDDADLPVPEILAYEEEIRLEAQGRLGPRIGCINPIFGTVFPNFSLNRAPAHASRV